MPKKPLIRSADYPYHITARSNNRDWFYIPQHEFWSIFLNIMSRNSVSSHIRVHALVLMSNHFHLIASSTDGNIDVPMRYLLREVSRRVNSSTGRINHLFGGPYKWSLITNTTYFLHCLKYVYRNPIRAGICNKVEDYAFSTVLAHQNPQLFQIPLHHWKWSGDWVKWGNFKTVLDWLNTDYPVGLSDYLKKGLRYSSFYFPKNRNTRKVPIYFSEDLPKIFKSSDDS